MTPAQMEIVRAVAEALKIPVFANGGSLDMHNYEDVIAFRDAAGCSSVMVARAAQHNLSVFRKEGASCGSSVCCAFSNLSSRSSFLMTLALRRPADPGGACKGVRSACDPVRQRPGQHQIQSGQALAQPADAAARTGREEKSA